MAEINADFEIQEEDVEESNAEKYNKKVRCWVGTWNNPSMEEEEFEAHLQGLFDQDFLKYACFQKEKGEKTGTLHFQFFVDFKNARTFKWVKENLPYGCHFKPMRSTKTHCRDYCTKQDTRVSEKYYEIGEFIEERQRTDLSKILELMKLGLSFSQVQSVYPTQCIMYKRQLMDYLQSLHNDTNKTKFRDVKVCYIYGAPGVGKTKYVYDKVGAENLFTVDMYDNSMFTHYDNENTLLLDEFTGKIDITYLNKLLDRYPVQLRGLNTVKYAGYENVYIVSNLSLKSLYKNEQSEQPTIYNALLRRIGKIIRIDDFGVHHIEKDIYDNSAQIELPFEDSEDLDF